MKNLILILALSFSASAQAIDLGIDLMFHASSLKVLIVNPKLNIEAEAGLVIIGDDEINLNLYERDEDGIFVPVLNEEFPIVSLIDSCGSKIITARSEMTEVDGLMKEIVVSDHRLRKCKDNKPLKTEVTYKTEALKTNTKIESYFAGEPLSPNLD